LFDNQRVLGLLYVDSHDLGMRFGEEQLELLTLLANMAAVKITNARLLETEQAHARMAHELAAAAEIQRGLLPVAPPALRGWRCDAYLESCYEVGGDLYDFYVGADGRMTLVVGDVTGKGMGAALLASSFLSSWRVLVDIGPDLGELARRLNAVTHRPNDPGRFVTGVIARLDPGSGTLEVVNAGHPAPALALDGALRRVGAGGPPFGVLPGTTYPIERTELRPGELLAICSDGIPEARHGEGFFEDERFEALLRAAGDEDPAALRARMLGEVRSFVGDEPRSDDITLVLIRRDR
jgi:serine phosphatase RsbU (regulator of sigma subunit)